MNELKRNEYLVLIEKISELDKKRFKLRKETNKINDRINTIRSKIILEICLMKDEKGKVIYSNEKVREAAIHLKLSENEEYCDLKEKREPFLNEDYIEYNKLIDQKNLLMLELGFPLQGEGGKFPLM